MRGPSIRGLLGAWRLPLRVAGAALALLCVAAGVSVSSAAASRGHLFKETFSKPCGLEPCEGSLKKPAGVAVSEASGDVYVVDKGANRVARFDQSGSYLGEFNGSGTLENAKGEHFEETEAGAGGRAGESGGGGGEPGERGEASGRFEGPEGIAVDNYCTLHHLKEPQCSEKDPSNGDLYVVDAGHRVIDKYDAEGKYLGQITAAGGQSLRTLFGVAVDAEGVAWVYQAGGEGEIDGFTYTSASEFTQSKTIFVSGVSGDFPSVGLAVDAEDNFYAAHFTAGSATRIAKLGPTGAALIGELGNEESPSVAVEQSSDNALVENLTSIGVFNAKGRELERLGREEGAEHLSEGAGIGVNAGAGTLYVADAGAGDVVVFGPRKPTVPLIEGESIANIASDSAELGGEVNPQSDEGEEETEYRFQYGACASSCEGSPYEASTPPGRISADFDVHAVSARIQGLKAGTTYHFRLVASNSHSPENTKGEREATLGEERTFTTQSSGGALVLSDNRGYELVSPPDKLGSLILPIWEGGVVQAAAGGQAIAYQANAPTELGAQGYSNLVPVLSARGAGAWSSRDIAIAHAGATGQSIGLGKEAKFYDAELTHGAVQPFGEFDPALSEEASEQTAFLQDLSGTCEGHCYRPLVTGKAPFANVPEGTVFGEEERCRPQGKNAESVACGPKFLGASEDLSHVVLGAGAELRAGAGKEQLYEWVGGGLLQVSVLPGGEAAAPGAGLAGEGATARGAITASGTRIAWEATSNLYLRDMALGKTVQLDKAEPCAGCESGGGHFQFASADGSRVFFSDEHRLSKDSGAEVGKHHADLYECRILLSGGELTCGLSDLTPQGAGGVPGEMQGAVLGGSADGSYLYFVAKGVLSEEENARGESAVAGDENLYVRHGASTSFIARLAAGDERDWDESVGQLAGLAQQPTRVSPSGRYLELMSEARLSGYDNRDATSARPVAEVYEYDASEKRLSCASCEPTGARPVGVEYQTLQPNNGGLTGGPVNVWVGSALVAANVPGWTVFGHNQSAHQPRYLTDEGRLFFNSADALVSQDANGTEDVYEYEPLGIRGPKGEELCSEAMASFSARSGGCVSLISSGSSAQESAFLDASESGDDVFFLTSAKLSPLDVDSARDVYDAHVCSESSPCIVPSSVQPPPCTTEASCKASPTPQPSIFGAPASATFQGPGNLPPSPPKAKTAAEVRAEHLSKALKACRAKKSKKKRAACETSARKRYGAKAAKHKKAKPKPRK